MNRLLEIQHVHAVKLFLAYARIVLMYQYSVDSLFCPPSADLKHAVQVIEAHIDFDFDYEGLRYDVATVQHMLATESPYVKYTKPYLLVKMKRKIRMLESETKTELEAVA